MKTILTITFLSIAAIGYSQKLVNPIIKNYGGIYDLPDAEEKIDPSLDYKIIIDVARESEKPEDVNWALNNVARLLNLHAMAGVPKEKLHVVLAIHGGAAFTVRNNEEYKKVYGVDNPNLELYKELQDSGVKMVVCGQSLVVRKIDPKKMVPGIKVASSMLTTITTHQLKGYALLMFN